MPETAKLRQKIRQVLKEGRSRDRGAPSHFHAPLVFLRLHGMTLKGTAAEATERMRTLTAGCAFEAELTAWARSRV